MITVVDNFLNRITMYRLVLYFLIFLEIIAIFFGYLGFFPYTPFSIFISSIVLLFFSLTTNHLFSRVYKTQTNTESAHITALILLFLISPMQTVDDFMFLMWAAIISMASKYILAVKHKHLFNPAAIALVLTSLVAGQSASWWIGNMPMAVLVIVGGLLIVRKIRRGEMVQYFVVTTVAITLLSGIIQGSDLLVIIKNIAFNSAIWFFGFIMLTEPLTTPPTKRLQIIYGIIVGILFSPPIHIANYYFSPELALVIGNIYVYLISPKEKLILPLLEINQLTSDIYDFIFSKPIDFSFNPGQYMEWTLGHTPVDCGGNRRYFTIASSPTENTIRLGVKFRPRMTSYKSALLKLKKGDTIVASQRAGDFTFPRDLNQKLVFIAGGIGITPFRSMLKYLLDKDKSRNIVLIYSNKTVDEIVYQNVLTRAVRELGIKVIYTLTDKDSVPPDWQGGVGRVDEEMLRKNVPDYKLRVFYISGPHAMVQDFQNTLRRLKVDSRNIILDYFPGFI